MGVCVCMYMCVCMYVIITIINALFLMYMCIYLCTCNQFLILLSFRLEIGLITPPQSLCYIQIQISISPVSQLTFP